MTNQSNAPAYSAAYWPETATRDAGAYAAPPALQMDPAEVFTYLQQNRQSLGLSNQFQAYNEGDAYVIRMNRADAQHLMDVMAGFASTYMQMGQRNPQLLQTMGQRLVMGQVGETACPCGGGCQCCGGGNGSWNRGNVSAYDSTQQPVYQQSIYQQPQDYIDQANNGNYNYPPGYNGGYNGYNAYNGYGWNNHNQGCGGGNPLMQSLGYGGNPQQMLRYAGGNIVSNLIYRGLGGGFGRFRL